MFSIFGVRYYTSLSCTFKNKFELTELNGIELLKKDNPFNFSLWLYAIKGDTAIPMYLVKKKFTNTFATKLFEMKR